MVVRASYPKVMTVYFIVRTERQLCVGKSSKIFFSHKIHTNLAISTCPLGFNNSRNRHAVRTVTRRLKIRQTVLCKISSSRPSIVRVTSTDCGVKKLSRFALPLREHPVSSNNRQYRDEHENHVA